MKDVLFFVLVQSQREGKAAWWSFDSEYLHGLGLAFPYLMYLHLPWPEQCQMKIKGERKGCRVSFDMTVWSPAQRCVRKGLTLMRAPWAQADNTWITLNVSLRELLNRQMSQGTHGKKKASSTQNTELNDWKEKIEVVGHASSIILKLVIGGMGRDMQRKRKTDHS